MMMLVKYDNCIQLRFLHQYTVSVSGIFFSSFPFFHSEIGDCNKKTPPLRLMNIGEIISYCDTERSQWTYAFEWLVLFPEENAFVYSGLVSWGGRVARRGNFHSNYIKSIKARGTFNSHPRRRVGRVSFCYIYFFSNK